MRIGIDLGGTKIETVALADDGDLLWSRRIPTPRNDYRATLSAISGLIEALEFDVGQSGTIGIGTPGAISPDTGKMKNCNSTVLNGKSFKQDLSASLGRPIAMANDADCFALSEAVDGAGLESEVVFGVILGTGTGGGLVVNRRLLAGPNAIAGEWGHNPMPVPWDHGHMSRHCYCGRSDCVETWLSGPAFELSYFNRTGVRLKAAEIASAAASGDKAALAVLDDYADKLARALAMVINIVDPGVIVLGGGMSNIEALYSLVPAKWQAYVFSDAVNTMLLPAKYGDASGVRGAAWLWPLDD